MFMFILEFNANAEAKLRLRVFKSENTSESLKKRKNE